MRRPNSLNLAGFIHPQGNSAPSLVTPVFSNGEQDYLQSAATGFIERFVPCETDDLGAQFIEHEKPDFRVSEGDEAVYGFVDSPRLFEFGVRAHITHFLKEHWYRFSSDPFLAIELSRFLGDRPRFEKAVSAAEKVLGDLDTEIAQRWKMAQRWDGADRPATAPVTGPRTSSIRNIAIIAHVDHGKTTLVDRLLQQSGVYRDNQRQVERAMDSNDLERERGITILAKAASVQWKDTRINIVDTPGHADFGGEVERILNMVDGALVLVDAAEGPLPQTKFVVSKALRMGLKPIVVINKVDRSDARPVEVINEVFDLFAALDATDEQLDFPILYGSAKQGWMATTLEGSHDDGMQPLFDLVLSHVKPPVVEEGPFRLLGTILEANPYLGRIITGRISSGSVKPNQSVKVLDHDGKLIETGRITKVLAFRGIERIAVDEAEAGDIVALAGLPDATVAHTICDPSVEKPIPAQPIDPPTLSMTFRVNDSPLAGTEGTKVTGRMIRDRLLREAEGNVALRVRESDDKDAMEVAGRGELQLGILIETMRREGFELSVSRPQVVLKQDEATGEWQEPIEEVVIDVDEEHSGIVVQKMSERRAEMMEMRPSGGHRLRLVFYAPTRGMIGYQGELLTDTRGTASMNRMFHGYAPSKGDVQRRRNGVLISNDQGEAVAYAIFKLEDRGPIMIEPGSKVYKGMIIGEHIRDDDIEINVLHAGIRTASKDEVVRLTPPIRMTLEKALAYIEDDELVEVTPKSIRLRKQHLDAKDRMRAKKVSQSVA
jgi:GTP-binding protein